MFVHQDVCVIEPYCTGKEFTVMVLENHVGSPVALLPSEMEFLKDKFFDYRKKYLPTNTVRYHTPAHFPKETIDKIRQEAEDVFSVFDMKDGARLD